MPKWEPAPLPSWKRSATRSSSGSSSCARLTRTRPRRARPPLTPDTRPPRRQHMNDMTTRCADESGPDLLTDTIESKLANPHTDSEFDLHASVDEVLKDVGMSTAASGAQLTFYGRDPIIPAAHRFGTMAAVGLAAKAVSVAALCSDGEPLKIALDVRKALRRFYGFFELKWETINGRPPVLADALNPFLSAEPELFRETRDGRHVVAINIYPKLAARALSLLRCGVSSESLRDAILQWRADDLEQAAAEAGLPMAKVRTFAEFRRELQYADVLSRMPLISLEKIGESEPVPFKRNAQSPLDGIRALGMGHVIAGAAIGRDLALYGADVR